MVANRPTGWFVWNDGIYIAEFCPYDKVVMRTFLMPIFVAVLSVFATPVMAAWDKAPDDASWLPPVVAVVLALLVLAANMKNAKRGHQD